ncbi:MAG: DUF58 domain-containing protein [Pseudomonadota bacterium]
MSTLSDLLPYDDADIYIKRAHHSLRPVGTFRQLLRRPTKLIESLRKYVVGDPVQFIDWKIYARSDQTLLREIKEESSVHVGLIFDVCDSMFWPSEAETLQLSKRVPQKMEIAWRVGLFLAASHLAKGDSLAFGIRTGTELYWIRSPKSKSEVLRLFQSLKYNHFVVSLKERVSPPRTLDRIWVLSDGLNGTIPIPHSAKIKTYIHIMASLELDASWLDDSFSYFDNKVMPKDYTSAALLPVYAQKLTEWQSRFKKEVLTEGLNYLQVSDSTSLEIFYRDIGSNGQL